MQQVFWDYSATKVLTLEYVPGIKISNLDLIKERGYSRSRISSHAIEAYLIQVFKNGLFDSLLKVGFAREVFLTRWRREYSN
ncbi:hypothetical protein L1887_32518 [Cichorium endivia]|nr:hypothetical protein L1887_32518 [Cichorium endivia]